MNIRFEKFSENDFPLYFKLVNDEQVMEMITERAIGIDEAKADYDKILENNRISHSFGNFKILDEETGEFIVLAKLEIESNESHTAELGYIILPQHWGKGIASRTGKKMIERAKKQPFLKTIFAIIDPKNLPSRKILANNGFVSVELRDFDGLPGEILELKNK